MVTLEQTPERGEEAMQRFGKSTPGRVNIKHTELEEETCLVCSWNGKDTTVAGMERMLRRVVGSGGR